MAILGWGKPTLEHTESVGGAPGESATWKKLPVAKKDTTKLTPTAGEEIKAEEEGGDVVDSRSGKNSSVLEFDIFVKKGEARPFDDIDGVIAGEHAFRLTPEDEECEGFQIDRASLRAEESYTAADGRTIHYVATALKPKEGRMVKPYTKAKGAS